MKLDSNQKVDHFDLTFEVPQPGISIVQFQEGIEKKTHEKSGKTTLRLPLQIDRVIEGPEENMNKKLSHFCPIETDFGERQIASILHMTGLLDEFAKKFQGDFSPLEDKFINSLSLKLPGKFIQIFHDIRKDQKGKDQVNITRFEKLNGAAEKPAKAAQKAKASVDEDDVDF